MAEFLRFSVIIIGTVNCLSYQENLIRELLNDSNYDDTLHPGVDDGHVTNVSIYLHFYGIHSINEQHMDFSAEIFFQQRWEDQRLVFSPNIPNVKRLYLVPKYIIEVWRPSVYFSNEKSATKHTVPQDNEAMYIYANGTIVYNMRISIKYGCAMQFKLFPFDVQTCDITIESYSYTEDVLQLKWENPALDIQNTELQHFILNKHLKRSEETDITQVGNFSSLSIHLRFERQSGHYILALFIVIKLLFGLTNYQTSNIGNFSSLSIHLRFERQSGHYILALFIPSVFIVILSWISFLVDPKVVHGRISLGSVTVLTMVSHYASVQKRVPSVSYVMAVDVWMIFCQFVVFSVLIEFAYVYYVYVFPGKDEPVKKDFERPKNKEVNRLMESQQTSFNDTSETMSMSVRIDKRISEKVYEPTNNEVQTEKVNPVDKWSRVIFPGIFILFIIIYSIAYGALANNQE